MTTRNNARPSDIVDLLTALRFHLNSIEVVMKTAVIENESPTGLEEIVNEIERIGPLIQEALGRQSASTTQPTKHKPTG